MAVSTPIMTHAPSIEQQGACRSMSTQSSELGDDRPLVACAFRPDGGQLAVGSWTGLIKLWSNPACSLAASHRCHDDRITGSLPASMPDHSRAPLVNSVLRTSRSC